MRLRQIALVAQNLEPVVGEICTNLGIEVAFRDPGVSAFGLENAVMPVGETFLEVVSPVQEGTTAGRYLDRRGGDGGYMVILQVDDIAPERRRVDDLGVRVVWEGKAAAWEGIHLHPADVGGAIVSFDRTDPPASWSPAGPEWEQHVRRDIVQEIAAVEVQSDDPDKLAARWSEVLGRFPNDDLSIELDSGAIRFTPATDGRGDGVGGVDFLATDRKRAGESYQICGTRFRLV